MTRRIDFYDDPNAPAPNSATVVYRPPVAVTASSGPGLRLSWIVYRGKASTVTIKPDQLKTWEDTRAYANSAWSPPYIIPEPPADGRWTADVTFSQPGTYVLRAVASDGSLFTYENVPSTLPVVGSGSALPSAWEDSGSIAASAVNAKVSRTVCAVSSIA